MSLVKLNHFLYLYHISFILLLTEAQVSHSSPLNNVNPVKNKLLSPITSKRMLKSTSASCHAECLLEFDKSKEGHSILVELGPSVNYTLTFPITDNGQNFSLKFNPSSNISFTVSLQKAESTDYVLFNDCLIKDGTREKLFISGDILSAYKNGRAFLELVNFSDSRKTVTVQFDYEEPSTDSTDVGGMIGSIIGGIIGFVCCCIVIRLLVILLIAILGSIFQWLGSQGGCTVWLSKRISNLANRIRNRRRRDNQHANQQDRARNAPEDGRQNPNIIALNNNNNNAAQPLTADTLNICFPEALFETLHNSYSQQRCSICCDDLATGAICRQLHCQHIFHSPCIIPWLQLELGRNQASCPICKADMRIYHQP